MKKKLLAVAVAGAMSTPAASFAAGPTLFGQLNQSLDYIDNDVNDGLRVSSNTSRLGAKGSMDLGEGLAAIYHLEFQVDLGGSDSNTLTNRNQFGGFKTPYGTFVLGRHDTPVKVIGRKVDLFWSSQLGTNRSLTDQNGHDARVNQAAGYISPDYGPLHAFLVYVPNTRSSLGLGNSANINDEFDAHGFSGALIYEDENDLFLAAGYEWFQNDDNVFGLPASGALEGGVIPGEAEDSTTAFRVTGKYTFGDFTIAGFFERDTDVAFVNGLDQNIFGGGIAYKLGANTFKGQVYFADDYDDTTVGTTPTQIGGNDTGALLWTFGVDHALSKAAQVYVQVAGLNADENAFLPPATPTDPDVPLYRLGGSGHGVAVGATPDETTFGVSAGWRIKF